MLQKLKQLDNLTIKFLIVGSVGFVANYFVLFILTNQLGVNKVVGEILGVAFALQVTFLLHDHWTYRQARSGEEEHLRVPLSARYALYLASNAFSSVSTIAMFSVLIRFISADVVALGVSAVLQTIWNYVFNRAVIWKHTET